MYVLLIYIFNFILTKNTYRFLSLYNSEIDLVIKGSGDQNFLSDSFSIQPSSVLINGELREISYKNTCNLVGDKNYITIIFDKPIQSSSNMFFELKNIIEVDLSKFDSSKLESMSNMFYNCENLEKINFGNINTSLVSDMRSLFNGCHKIKYLDLSSFNTSRVTDMGYMFSDCENLMYLDLSNFNTQRLSTMEYMFKGCKMLQCLNLYNFKFEKNHKPNKEKSFEGLSLNVKYCINDLNTKDYLLDGIGNSTCLDLDTCFNETKIIKDIYYSSRSIESNINIDYHYTSYLNYNENSIIDKVNYSTNINIIENKVDINIQKFRELLHNFSFTENNEIIKIDKNNSAIYQLTTIDKQKNNTNKNISTIDFRDCEKILKDKYDINQSLSLIILKIDYFSPDTLIPIIGYEVYHPLNKSKLNLSHCEDILIKLNIPVLIDENSLFKYDPNSDFYQDNCFPYTTENGTDIILNDRKKNLLIKIYLYVKLIVIILAMIKIINNPLVIVS